VARIPYVDAGLEEPADLIAAIKSRRGGALLNLDRMLLHSPPLARGWNAFLGEIRTGLQVPAAARELAMCFVAVLNDAPYEFAHHSPLYLAAGGRQCVLDAMRLGADAAAEPGLRAEEAALLRLCFESTRHIKVQPATREAARAALGSDRELVAFIAVIGAYNMVSRFLVATGVTLEDDDVD
jgi:alkylhydroperoxidase family enzyme